jgi:hypothetical protein|tara:strand:- start:456 stop:779 length:324 start_codon:yes stop_codon:yes gene_type:complete
MKEQNDTTPKITPGTRNTIENGTLKEVVEKDNELKNFVVGYVGKKLDPEDGDVNVEMIVEVFAEEFPEFLMALAEENFIRGYQQAFVDIETSLQTRDEAPETTQDNG